MHVELLYHTPDPERAAVAMARSGSGVWYSSSTCIR